MEQKTIYTEVSKIGEFGLIEHLTKDIELNQPSTVLGVGDDAAVIGNHDDHYLLLATDMLLEGIHFDLHYSPLKHLGYKAVVVNCSDILAMNGEPQQMTVSIAASSKFPVEAFEEIYAGIELAAKNYKVDLVGGDMSSSHQGLMISISVLGRVHKNRICYRSTAKEGDYICHSGSLGAAYLGLQILEREKRIFLENPGVQPELKDHSYLLERQLKPELPIKLLDYFKNLELVPTSMIDISDGLASDLKHICKQSGVGALIEEEYVMIREEAQLMALEFKLDPITCALSGGEDYELLFTVSEEDYQKVFQIPEISIIGRIRPEGEGVVLKTMKGNHHPITAQGWKHFE